MTSFAPYGPLGTFPSVKGPDTTTAHPRPLDGAMAAGDESARPLSLDDITTLSFSPDDVTAGNGGRAPSLSPDDVAAGHDGLAPSPSPSPDDTTADDGGRTPSPSPDRPRRSGRLPGGRRAKPPLLPRPRRDREGHVLGSFVLVATDCIEATHDGILTLDVVVQPVLVGRDTTPSWQFVYRVLPQDLDFPYRDPGYEHPPVPTDWWNDPTSGSHGGFKWVSQLSQVSNRPHRISPQERCKRAHQMWRDRFGPDKRYVWYAEPEPLRQLGVYRNGAVWPVDDEPVDDDQ